MFLCRKFHLFKKGKFVKDVIQISSLTYSEDGKDSDILKDVLQKTLDHCSASSSPIAVHSATGLGVTGVFIALFKLRDDIYNTE